MAPNHGNLKRRLGMVDDDGGDTTSAGRANKKARSSRHPDTAASPITEASFLPQLPGAVFGLGRRIVDEGYWSVEAEARMRQDAAAEADVLLELSGCSGAELQLWLVLHRDYRCGVGDLFRYGLKPCFNPRGWREDATFDEYCAKLAALLAHPVFAGRIELARFALQTAVIARYDPAHGGHAEPLAPPYSHRAPAFVSTARQWAGEAAMRRDGPAADVASAVRSDEAEMSSWLFAAHQPQDFFAFMEDVCRHTHRSRYPASAYQKTYFLLSASDIDLLASVLESDGRWPPAPVEFYGGYKQRCGWSAPADHEAALAWMQRQKHTWLLAGFREAAIRQAMGRRWADDAVLLDIPPFDPDPLYRHDPDTSEDQLRTYEGSGLRNAEHASVLWCKRAGVACR